MNTDPAQAPGHDCKDERDRLARTTTHLANARTYLAWVRTSIAIMAFGFVLERVDLLFLLTPGVAVPHETVRQLGLVSRFCFGAGAAVLLLAAARSRAIAKRSGPGPGPLLLHQQRRSHQGVTTCPFPASSCPRAGCGASGPRARPCAAGWTGA